MNTDVYPIIAIEEIPTSAAPSGVPSATIPDWSREHKGFFEWNPPRSLLASLRSYQRHRGRPNPYSWIVRKLAVLRYGFWEVICGTDIDINCSIGGGLAMPHPNGVVILGSAQIGPNCLILQQVTVGTTGVGAPILAGHVDVGAGAKILGPIRVGAHAKIGANAVVLHDVPVGATAVGIPARIIGSTRRRRSAVE
jgi:serine O-acetyltransferase